MTLNPKQQQEFAQRMNDELEKITMSWNIELKEWHPYAIQALQHNSVVGLKVPAEKYARLLGVDKHGINMNVLAVLANNLELRTPFQMGCTVEYWTRIIELNIRVGVLWEALCAPLRQKVMKEFEIMAGRETGLKIVKAEA